MSSEYSSRLTSKGQITIPLAVRETLSLAAGDEVAFVRQLDGSFSLEPRNLDTRSLRGIVKGQGTAVSLEAMEEAIKAGAARGER
jgi:AbrB family looped-hinge helix DNA binding protein